MTIAAALLLSACEPVYRTHGYVPRADELDQVTAGRDTRGSVLRKLGRPTTIGTFESTAWYYVHTKTRQRSFLDPVITDRKVVAVRFNPDGAVEQVNRYGVEDGQIIDLITKTTPTYGRELTILQQIFGNIGRFNPTDFSGG